MSAAFRAPQRDGPAGGRAVGRTTARNRERGPRKLLPAALLIVLALGCSDSSGPAGPSRSYRLGFSPIPPRADTTRLSQVLQLTAQHSDAGLVQLEIPWAVLLADTAAATEVRVVRLPLVQFYRATGRAVVVALDVTNGLNRAAEAPELVAAGRSIADTAVQRRYREYVAAVDTVLHPDYLSLAAETNLIRLAAPDSVYRAVVAMTRAAAAERKAHGSRTPLLVSVQVETAWGLLQGGTTYVGVAQDLADFPFIRALGLSSYPYLGGFTGPEQIPDDYYLRLVSGTSLRPLVLEGGWPSSGYGSTPARQAYYLLRQSVLLSRARALALFQITMTDLDTTIAPALGPFAHLGLVDTALVPKPALATWDSLLALPFRP